MSESIPLLDQTAAKKLDLLHHIGKQMAKYFEVKTSSNLELSILESLWNRTEKALRQSFSPEIDSSSKIQLARMNELETQYNQTIKTLYGTAEELDAQKEINEKLKEKLAEAQKKTQTLGTENNAFEKQLQILEARDPNKHYQKYDETVIQKFYDCVIQVTTLKELSTQWRIKFSDYATYQKIIKHQGIISCITGLQNRGKSLIFALLNNEKVPSGHNINTEGISVKYFQDQQGKGAPFIGIDTKGQSPPIFCNSIDKIRHDDLDDCFKDNMMAYSSIPDSRTGTNPNDYEESKDEREKIFSENNDIYAELLRDHLAVEQIIQNFIFEVSNIIIVVVGELTQDDQRIVYKSQRLMSHYQKKRMIVIHNLMHHSELEDCQQEIQKILRSFPLKSCKFAGQGRANDGNNFYWSSTKNSDTIHLLMARDGTPAGLFYNPNTIHFIQTMLNVTNQAKVNICEKFHENLERNLPSYLKKKITSDKKLIRVLTEEDIKYYDDDESAKQSNNQTPDAQQQKENRATDLMPIAFQFSSPEPIQLKKLTYNEIGTLDDFKSAQSARYQLRATEKHLYLLIEAPGVYCKEQISIKKVPDHDEYYFAFQANRSKQKHYSKQQSQDIDNDFLQISNMKKHPSMMICDNLEFNDLSFHTYYLKHSQYPMDNITKENTKISFEGGYIIIQFAIANSNLNNLSFDEDSDNETNY